MGKESKVATICKVCKYLSMNIKTLFPVHFSSWAFSNLPPTCRSLSSYAYICIGGLLVKVLSVIFITQYWRVIGKSTIFTSFSPSWIHFIFKIRKDFFKSFFLSLPRSRVSAQNVDFEMTCCNLLCSFHLQVPFLIFHRHFFWFIHSMLFMEMHT